MKERIKYNIDKGDLHDVLAVKAGSARGLLGVEQGDLNRDNFGHPKPHPKLFKNQTNPSKRKVLTEKGNAIVETTFDKYEIGETLGEIVGLGPQEEVQMWEAEGSSFILTTEIENEKSLIEKTKERLNKKIEIDIDVDKGLMGDFVLTVVTIMLTVVTSIGLLLNATTYNEKDVKQHCKKYHANNVQKCIKGMANQ